MSKQTLFREKGFEFKEEKPEYINTYALTY